MILIDTALERRAHEGRPIPVVISGAGWMGRRITAQVATMVGMEVVGVINRTPASAEKNLLDAGYDQIEHVTDPDAAARCITGGGVAVSTDPNVLCSLDHVEVVVEATGDIGFGASVALAAIGNRKHLVLDNAELDATVGPILKKRAEAHGVVVSGIDGDEPAVAMNLLRLVRTLGLTPVLVGNIKGFLDPHRNPATQAGFAKQHGQDAAKVASFADGTKMSAECTTLANATGFGVATTGMYGLELDEVTQVLDRFDPAELLDRPLVDYVLGAKPGSGAFVVGYEADAERRAAMAYLKMGPGPLHLFTRPFHLPHLETPITVARAALFHDAAVTPKAGPVCEMVAMAKQDLEPGDELDGIGGFTNYAVIENADEADLQRLLPMGLTPGARMRTAVRRDHALTFDDVEVPDGIVPSLREEQGAAFGIGGMGR
jgi:predicted homoserine dehydrogenase-like protein